MDNSANEIESHSFDSKHVCQLIDWICTVPGVKDESQNFSLSLCWYKALQRDPERPRFIVKIVANKHYFNAFSNICDTTSIPLFRVANIDDQ